MQPQHTEEQEFPAAPSCSEHPPHSSQGSSKLRSPGRLLSRQGSLGRPLGRATSSEAEVSVWIKQQNIPAVLPPPARLIFIMGFEAQGREQAPAHQVCNKTQPEVQPRDYRPRRGTASPQLVPSAEPGVPRGRRAATAEREGMSAGRRSQEAAAVPPARLGRQRWPPGAGYR